MKVSLHSGRHKTLKHNQHNFESEHIDKERSKDNLFYLASKEAKTCEESAYHVYKELYSKAVEIQNEKYRKKGQYDRLRTTDDWVKAPRYLPHEDIFQIGDMEDHATPKDLLICMQEFLKWKQETFGSNIRVISVSIHLDEATPHVHDVDTMFYFDEDGICRPGVAKALEQLKIPLPDPTKPVSKENNRLMVYTEICRRKWQEIVIAHGYEIDTVPDPTKKHKSTEQYKAERQAEKALKASEKALAEKYALAHEKWLKTQNTTFEEHWKAESEKLRKAANRILVKKKKELEAQYQQKLQELKQQELENQKSISLGRQVQAEQMSKNVEKSTRDLPDLPFEIK